MFVYGLCSNALLELLAIYSKSGLILQTSEVQCDSRTQMFHMQEVGVSLPQRLHFVDEQCTESMDHLVNDMI